MDSMPLSLHQALVEAWGLYNEGDPAAALLAARRADAVFRRAAAAAAAMDGGSRVDRLDLDALLADLVAATEPDDNNDEDP